MTAYIILGTKECVSQDEIGGPFVPHPTKEIVTGFLSMEQAQLFIEQNRLKEPKRQSYGDTSYYKRGYYEMEIESVEIV